MKKLILTLSLLAVVISLSAQNFFREEFSRDKNYVIMVNPTAGNIGVVKFLLDKGVLDVDLQKIEFVGVYHSSQEYNFTQASDDIEKNGLTAFHLHEVKGVLNESAVYSENPCTDDFRKIFRNLSG
jgi:putative glutamine amidotransferase